MNATPWKWQKINPRQEKTVFPNRISSIKLVPVNNQQSNKTKNSPIRKIELSQKFSQVLHGIRLFNLLLYAKISCKSFYLARTLLFLNPSLYVLLFVLCKNFIFPFCFVLLGLHYITMIFFLVSKKPWEFNIYHLLFITTLY